MTHSIRSRLAIPFVAAGLGLAASSLPASAEVTSFADSGTVLAQSNRPQRPPKEAVEACSGKSSGTACSFATQDGQLKGSCQSPGSNVPAACVPAGSQPKG